MSRTADERRASGQRNIDERRASGQRNINERRASGQKFRDDLRSLAELDRRDKSLPELPVRGATPASRGVAHWNEPASTGGGGMPGSLAETVGTRTKYSSLVIIPDGGFFAYLVSPIKTMEFEYTGGKVKFTLQQPDYTIV